MLNHIKCLDAQFSSLNLGILLKSNSSRPKKKKEKNYSTETNYCRGTAKKSRLEKIKRSRIQKITEIQQNTIKAFKYDDTEIWKGRLINANQKHLQARILQVEERKTDG